MQFIDNGPDIPERLLQAHEDGKVVFFCGAGISYPAGLPDFEGLVRQLYNQMGVAPTEIQENAIKSGQYDTAVGLLESSDVEERKAVRKVLAKILTPSNLTPNATATHRDLLTLGKTREGKMRLITTNFDRIFEEVIHKEAKKAGRKEEQRYQAPLLPVPKNHWNGLVYLHGLLPPESDGERDHLVLSSGDFGLAYLTERWAARFTSELFRNYTVCFIGYSINDSILRYMMDALAADRLRGESSPKAFAFGGYSKGKRDEQAEQWQAKNVTPILYSEDEEHSYLHRTLHSWSEIYHYGLIGKKQIVASLARAKPLKSTKEDNFVDRMLWALSDPIGSPARLFAKLNPVPSLDWLDYLSENRYGHNDLGRFGVPQRSANNNELTFSFVKRPPPYDKALSMALVDVGAPNGKWDEVMRHLGKWLVRHLDDPKLVLWVARQGGCLHYEFKELIQQQLEKFDKLEKEKDQEGLNRIRASSPKAIPSPLMRTLWELILSGRLADHYNRNLHLWFKRFNLAGLTPSLRMELLEILTPRIKIGEPFAREYIQSEADAPQHMVDLVRGEIILAYNFVHNALKAEKNNSDWESTLPDLLDDFNLLLRDAFDLMRALEKADDFSDQSYFEKPSISEHPQNRDFNDWTALIDLARDAWIATAKKDTEQARLIAEGWWKTPYPLFKRLAFFAATEREDVISCQQALRWLLADDTWWLWSEGTQRETMRLLASLARRLDATEMSQLEQVILQKPPTNIDKLDTLGIKKKQWNRFVDRSIWLRLARLQSGGVELSQKASSKLESLAKQYSWHLEEDERDDFPTWTGPVVDIVSDISPTPQGKDELIEWLRKSPKADDWHDRCKQDFDTTADALIYWANKGEWLEDWWPQALSAWADDELLEHSWGRIPKVIIAAPDSLIEAVARELGWWLEKQANKFSGQDKLFLGLIKRILKLNHQGATQVNDNLLSRAINHSVGLATEALLKWWYRGSLEDGQGLPDEIRHLLTHICDTKYEGLRHGRVVLATHVITLFRIDEEWTSTNLLPLFDWQQSEEEAQTVWVGFLWYPRLYWPLMAAIKQPFLATIKHHEKLGKLGIPPEQYISLLTLVALNPGDTFTKKEISNAIRALSQKGILSFVKELVRMLEGAGEQRRDYWRNRVKPYLLLILPRSGDVISLEFSTSLAQLCVAAEEAFPEAYKRLKGWLQPLKEGDAFLVVPDLYEAKLSEQFPKEALAFLDAIICNECRFPPTELNDCLKAIQEKQPDLERDKAFQRLSELSRIS